MRNLWCNAGFGFGIRPSDFFRISEFGLRPLLACFVALLATNQLCAEVSLPHILDSNMVLQRDCSVPIWGWAAPGERVTVRFAGQSKNTTAATDGSWRVKLGSLKASDVPAEMVITGSNSLVLTNILVGEVWFCSGQSNMEKPIGTQSGQKPVKNFVEELKSGDAYPTIRLFKAERVMSPTPAKDVKGLWRVCSSNALETMKFTAVGYFFAREIQHEIHVPIGLVEAAWGGTRIEPWTPPVGFDAVPKVARLLASPSEKSRTGNQRPSVLYNGMVAPLKPFAVRGALWYQGESNCIDQPDGPIYADKMEALIKGWRQVWGQGKFPFYFVQLAPYYYYSHREKPRVPNPDALPELWEGQTRALRVKNTGMVVINDLVEDPKDIHPTRKVEVGQRLARLALARDYGQKDLVCSGPTFKRMKIREGKMVISFDNADGGLVSKDGQPLTWFTIAGADGKFVPAEAVIDGDKVIVSSPAVPEPKAVRFAWNEAATPNLFNRAGLPAGAFRTDSSENGK